MIKTKKTITDELDLLIKRQSKGEEKTAENELSLVEKLEAELKERKKEARQKMKEEEDKQILKIARFIMKQKELKNPEELTDLLAGKSTGTSLTAEQEEALKPLLQSGKEIMDQPNKFLDLNVLKISYPTCIRRFQGNKKRGQES